MPIHVPGFRNRKGSGNRVHSTKREVVAVLQLTAMVDMFTVLVVFLLQNYASTNQILHISDQVQLPQATSTEQLIPSLVVAFSKDGVMFNGKQMATSDEVKRDSDWMLEKLRDKVIQEIRNQKEKTKNDFVVTKKEGLVRIFPYEKITLQADEDIEFLSIKKVMYTLTEAGVKEINFAVLQIKEYS